MDDRVRKIYIAMLKNNATTRVTEFASRIEIMLEWEEPHLELIVPCKQASTHVYCLVDVVLFEKVVRKSKEWLGNNGSKH